MRNLVHGIGTGGGHKNKAGGYIIRSKFEETYVEMNFTAYLLNRLKEYFTSYDVIELDKYEIDLSDMKLYERLPTVYGMCKSTELDEVGATVKIRTINRELEVTVADTLYVLMNPNVIEALFIQEFG